MMVVTEIRAGASGVTPGNYESRCGSERESAAFLDCVLGGTNSQGVP